jgi:UPF0716 protein FxsA
MRLLFIFAILLAFPVLELWILIELAAEYGWWVLGYLVVMIVLGWRLIQDEKQQLFGRVAQILATGGTPARAVFGSAKNLLAGILLILPGIISDILAAVLLLLPDSPAARVHQSASDPQRRPHRAANDDVIEGEFRRED